MSKRLSGDICKEILLDSRARAVSVTVPARRPAKHNAKINAKQQIHNNDNSNNNDNNRNVQTITVI